MWAFRFTAPEGKRAQMEFAGVGDRDSAGGDVPTPSSAREKAREYKVALKREGIEVAGLDPHDPGLDHDTALARASSAPGRHRTLRVAAADAPAAEQGGRPRTGAGLGYLLPDTSKIAGRFPGSAVADPSKIHLELVVDLSHGPHPNLEKTPICKADKRSPRRRRNCPSSPLPWVEPGASEDTESAKSWMCRQGLRRSVAPVLLSKGNRGSVRRRLVSHR